MDTVAIILAVIILGWVALTVFELWRAVKRRKWPGYGECVGNCNQGRGACDCMNEGD